MPGSRNNLNLNKEHLKEKKKESGKEGRVPKGSLPAGAKCASRQ